MNVIIYLAISLFTFAFKITFKICKFTGLYIPIIVFFILRHLSHKLNYQPYSFMDYTTMVIFYLSFLPPIAITLFKIIKIFKTEE